MKKPNDTENTQASGDFTPVELGGHYLTIKDVAEMKSKSGKDMIRVSFDLQQTISSQDILWSHSKMISVQIKNGRIRQRNIF